MNKLVTYFFLFSITIASSTAVFHGAFASTNTGESALELAVRAGNDGNTQDCQTLYETVAAFPTTRNLIALFTTLDRQPKCLQAIASTIDDDQPLLRDNFSVTDYFLRLVFKTEDLNSSSYKKTDVKTATAKRNALN